MRNYENAKEKKIMKTEIEKNNKELKNASLLVVFGFLIMVLSMLLPFATAKEGYRDYLKTYAHEWEKAGMDKEDVMDVSLVEYIRVYTYAISMGVGEEIAMAFLVLVGIVFIMGIICVEGAVHKKPKGVIAADIIGALVYVFMCMDFVGRNVIGGDKYEFGYGIYVYGVAAIVIFLGAVIMIRTKKKNMLEEEKVN